MNPNFVAKKEIKILVKAADFRDVLYVTETFFKLSNKLKYTYTNKHSRNFDVFDALVAQACTGPS